VFPQSEDERARNSLAIASSDMLAQIDAGAGAETGAGAGAGTRFGDQEA